MLKTKWTRTDEDLPFDNTLCVVITESGDERLLLYSRRMWWLPDRSMYVYFTPLMWRPKEAADG